MKKLIIILVTSTLILFGCSEPTKVVEQVEDFKVEEKVIEYDGVAVPIKKDVLKIDETMNVRVKNGDQVNTDSVLYDIVDESVKQQINQLKYELDLDYAELKSLNEKILATNIDDPMLTSLREQRDGIDRKIKLTEFNMKNTSTEEKIKAKFEGKVYIDNQTGDVIVTSNEYGVELNATYDTLKDILDQKLYITIGDKNYNLVLENYIPVSAEGQSGNGYKVFYKIENLDQKLIDGQPMGIKRTSNDIFVPSIYFAEKDGIKYLKVNGTTTEVQVEDGVGKSKIISGVAIGDTISTIGEDDDIFK